MMSGKLGRENYFNAIFAGKSTFTIFNANTGNRYTYKVKQGVNNPDAYHVMLMTGSDNNNDFTFIGTIFEKRKFNFYKNCRIDEKLPSIQGFIWFLIKVATNQAIGEHVEMWHEGKCCKCGRKLTTPDSLKSGFGPECIKML